MIHGPRTVSFLHEKVRRKMENAYVKKAWSECKRERNERERRLCKNISRR